MGSLFSGKPFYRSRNTTIIIIIIKIIMIRIIIKPTALNSIQKAERNHTVKHIDARSIIILPNENKTTQIFIMSIFFASIFT